MQNEELQVKENINISTGIITFIDDDFLTVLSGNIGFYNMIGYSQVQFKILQRNRMINLMNFDVGENTINLLKRQLKNGTNVKLEFKMAKKSGEIGWFVLSGYSMENKNNYNTLVCEIVDVTEIKRLNDAYNIKSSDLNILTKSIPGGVATICYDDKFTILYANDEYYKIGGYTKEEVETIFLNQGINFIHPEDRIKLSQTIANQVLNGNVINAEFRIVKKNGEVAWIMLKANRIPDKGEAAIFQCVFIDITEKQYYYEELKQVKREMELITENISSGVVTIMLDEGFSILSANDNFYFMTGYTKEEYYRKCIDKLIYPIHPHDRPKFIEVVHKQVASRKNLDAEYRFIKKDGSNCWVIFKGEYIGQVNSTPVYQCILIENTTAKIISEETKRVKKELNNVANSIPVGIVTFEISNKISTVYANEGYFSMAGYTKEEGSILIEDYLKTILHPEDKERVINKLLLQTTIKKSINIEARIIKKDRSIAWIQISGNRIAINDKCIYQCAFVDITEHKMAIITTEIEREHYRIISEQSNDVIYKYDIQNDNMIYSSKYKEIYDRNPVVHGFLKNISSRNTIYPNDIENFRKLIEEINSGKKHYYKEIRIKDKYGVYNWCAVEGSSIFEDGHAIMSVGKISNIHERKKEKEDLIWNSQHDELTKLFNKNKIQALIQNIIRNSNNDERHAMLVIDADNFKNINDYLGYVFADNILVEAAGAITKLVGDAGVVGRFSEDEFIIFLKNVTSKDMIIKAAESICKLFKNIYCGEEDEWSLSSSIGIALYPKDGGSYYELLNSADRALHSVKSNGKNSYKFYDPENDFEYHIKKNNSRKTKELSKSIIRQSFNTDSLTANIFEILFETKDIKSAINLSLSLIGKKLNLSGVSIFDTSNENELYEFEFEWFDKGSILGKNELVDKTARQFNNYGNFFREDGLFICNDIENPDEDNEIIVEYFKNSKVKAIIQYAFYDNGAYKGFVSFYDCRRKRVWSENEIESIALITKMLWSYLIKYHEQEKMQNLVYLDGLTGIPNLQKFNMEVENLLKKKQLNNYAIISFDIEKFKFINDTYGHEEGNKVLGYVTSVITSVIKENEMFARVSADNFVALIDLADKDKFLMKLRETNARIQYIANSNNKRYRIVFACGIYAVQEQDDNVTTMIDRANIARKTTKGLHESSFAFYSEIVHSQMAKEIEIEYVMEDALHNKEFEIYIQPKVKLSSKEIVGAEALVRWERKGYGLIEAEYFIPIFEKNGFIEELDFYVFEEVHRKMRLWMNAGKNVLPMSINLSRVHLRDGQFIERLLELAEKYSIPTSLIEIELSENVFIDNIDRLLVYMYKLKELGYKISLDDFGAGYSSLNLLKDLPVDILKIDSEFFRSNSDHKREKIIIESIVDMTKKLGITVLTEGVETEEQCAFLEAIGCDLVQGFVFAKPMPINEFEEIL